MAKESIKRILIFAYYSYKDPVFQSAVLPYFINFPNKESYQFFLVTFEQERFALTNAEHEGIASDLHRQNIYWSTLKWHSGRLKLVKKVYDLVAGVIKTARLVKRKNVDIIYSEAFPGAVISHFVARITGRPHIVHTFEPHADYMIESGVWRESNWEARLLKRFELIVARKAAALLTATQAMIDKLQGKINARMYRVPSCVDLTLFQFDQNQRDTIRAKHLIAENEIVVTYMGKLGGMYVREELFEFFDEVNLLQEKGSYTYRFMILTTEPSELVGALIDESNIPAHLFIVENLARTEVPGYLSAADIGFCGIRPIESRRYSSPIKDGEYWACGLPVIIPDGISDDYLFVEKHKIGWRLNGLNRDGYRAVLAQVVSEWNWSVQAKYRQRARAFVDMDRSVANYQYLYDEIFSANIKPGSR